MPGTGGVCAEMYTKRGTPASLAVAMAAALAVPLMRSMSAWLPKAPTQLMAARAPGNTSCGSWKELEQCYGGRSEGARKWARAAITNGSQPPLLVAA
jgi:hypothetical protein